MRMICKIMLSAVIVVLSSCGGGGSSSGGSGVSQSIVSQSSLAASSSSFSVSSSSSNAVVLSFQNKGTVYLIVGESYINTLVANTTTSVAYSLDNPSVATIDSTGKLSALAQGEVIIEAEQQGQIDSYKVVVSPRDFKISTWVGRNDTQLSFPTANINGSLLRTSELPCYLQIYSLCKTGDLSSVSESMKDTQWTLDKDAYYSFIFGNREAKQFAVAADKMGYRWSYETAFFKNRFFLIGGIDGHSPAAHGEIWSSFDGVNWVQVLAEPPFGTRFSYKLIVFNDKLWLYGGYEDGKGERNDAWSSSDGVVWIKEVVELPFAVRTGHSMVAWKNKIWLFGGQDDRDKFYYDVWSSIDGVNWRQESAASSFPGRINFQLQAFGDQLVMIGGWNGSHRNDVWASSDGASWSKRADKIPFWSDYSSFVINNKMWVFGSPAYGQPQQFWYSTDLETWTGQATSLQRSANFFADSKGVRALGGQLSNGTFTSWISSDAVNWQHIYRALPLEGRKEFKLVTFNDAIWIFGQYADEDQDLYQGDILSSTDGLAWSIKLETAPFKASSDIQVVVFDKKLWVYISPVAGVDAGLWSSDDGIHWMSHASDSNVRGRLVVHNNQLWVIANGSADAWISSSGDTWQKLSVQETASSVKIASFKNRLLTIAGSIDGQSPQLVSDLPALNPARTGYELIVFDERLWIVGGGNTMGGGFDVWSTADGSHWQQEVAVPEFGKRYYPKVTALNGNIFVFGGSTVNYFYDVWKSPNGIEWRKGKKLSFRFD